MDGEERDGQVIGLDGLEGVDPDLYAVAAGQVDQGVDVAGVRCRADVGLFGGMIGLGGAEFRLPC